MKQFSLRLYQFIFLLKILLDATAQDNEHEFSLPAAKGTDHTSNIGSQKFYQASAFNEEQTKTQDKDTTNLQQIPCSRKENLALTDNTIRKIYTTTVNNKILKISWLQTYVAIYQIWAIYQTTVNNKIWKISWRQTYVAIYQIWAIYQTAVNNTIWKISWLQT